MHKTSLMLAARPRLIPILIASLLSGCVSPALLQTTRGGHEAAVNEVDSDRRTLTDAISQTRDAKDREEEVNKPYLVGKPVPLARDVTLPLSLRANTRIAALWKAGRISLPVAAQRITLATGIPVKIEPDVYLDRSALLPKGQDLAPSAVGAAAPAAANSVPVAGSQLPSPLVSGGLRAMPQASLGSPYQAAIDTPYDFQFDPMDPNTAANPTGAGLCDLIATRLGLNWEYDDQHGVIRFYRMVTKTWQIPVSPALTSYTTAFTGANHQTTNQNALQTTNTDSAPVKSESTGTNELDAVKASIATVMTRSGNVAVNNATGTITLTDTKQAVDEANDIIHTQVAILSRIVILKIRTVQVTTTDDGESGVDWTAILTKALQHLPAFSLTAISPATLVSSNSGSIGLNVLSGAANGTQAIIQALNDIGRVQTSTELPLATRNRHPIFYNVRNQFSYVSATTPATATAGGTGGIPGITTAQDEVGTKLMIYPNATSRDDVVLTVSLDQSVLQSIQTFSSGSGANVQSVQLPNVTGEGSTQEVPIHNGQTLLLTGFDRVADQYDKRTMGNGLPLIAGGSLTSNRTRTTTIVIVSVVVRDPNS